MRKTILIAGIVVLLGTATSAATYYSYNPVIPKSATPSQKIAPKPDTKVNPPNRQELLALTNAERAKVGVAPLVESELLDESAQAKADDMEANKYYGHVSPITGKHGYTYIDDVGVRCVFRSENITADTTSQGAIDDWLGSPKHKDALLDNKNDLTGFGISQGPGYLYIVMHFCDLP